MNISQIQVFFKNPSFGLDNNLKSGTYKKASDDELQSVEVLGPMTASLQSGGREVYNYSIDSEDRYGDLDFKPQPLASSSRPVSEMTGKHF